MNNENRCGLNTCANTNVWIRPVAKAPPAVSTRSEKNGSEMRRRLLMSSPPLFGFGIGDSRCLVLRHGQRGLPRFFRRDEFGDGVGEAPGRQLLADVLCRLVAEACAKFRRCGEQ